MHKWIMTVLLVAACVFGLSAMAGAVDKHAKESAPEDTGGMKQLKIVASNWKFDKPEYTVTKGDTMKVTLSLYEGIHEMEIVGYNVKLDKNNPSAQVTFDKPGTYVIHCILPCGQGHAQMESKLIVQ